MPGFSISSNVDKVHNLINYDIDENLTDIILIVNTILIMIFVTSPKAFNIFHANVDGLQPHFEYEV